MRNDDILFGVAYYPEHDLPQAAAFSPEWERDAALMARLGLDVIRVGEFCWSRMQRKDGTLTLDWLERLVDLFHARGIRTILCTPTATPPVWVVERFPDLPVVLPDGRRGEFGGRRHYSVFHEGYRALCRGIASALAERFGAHPGVAGWHVDNEVGSYGIVDCSPPALRAFHAHLARRFADPAELNRRWGLIFWDQEVERFDQVPAPTEMMATRSPQFLLEYNRFCLDGMADFILAQAEAVRARCGADQWIVGSCTEPVSVALFRKQRAVGRELLDYVELNNYPELLPAPGQASMRLDRYRAVDRPRPFLTLEHQIGSGHTTTGGLDGRVRRFWAWETLARGSRSVVWWQWRRFRTGCEWRLTSVVERDRRPRSIYRDLADLIRRGRALAPLLRTARVVADAQILYDLECALARDRASEPVFWMQIQLPDGWQHRFPLWEQEARRAVYLPLTGHGLTVDFVRVDEPWNPALPLFVTDLDLCGEAEVEKLRAYCESGGRLVCFPGVGERNQDGAQTDVPSPGRLGPLLGVSLADYYPLQAGMGSTYDPALGRMTACDYAEESTEATVSVGQARIPVDVRHGEVLDVVDAEIVGLYSGGPCDGWPVITRRRIGRGEAVYLGAVPPAADLAASLYRLLLPDLLGEPIPYRCVNIETDAGPHQWLLNGAPDPCPLPSPVHDVITNTPMDELPPWGVCLCRRRRDVFPC